MKFTIPIQPITKKNHNQVIVVKGRTVVLPSKPYKEYEKACMPYLSNIVDTTIDYQITLKCHFYMGHKRKCDITNLLQAICDILVKYGVIIDDNYTIIASTDGTRVFYDKQNPRTEIEITKYNEKEMV